MVITSACFIEASTNHITKSEFFVAFQAAHDERFRRDNIITRFRGASLEPLDIDAVNSTLDIQIGTPDLFPPVLRPLTNGNRKY